MTGIYQSASALLNNSYAVVAADGSVVKQRNFPWEINKITTEEGQIVYNIKEYYGDSSSVFVKTNNKAATVEIYNAMDDIGIKFVGSGFGNPIIEDSFTVEIKK